jgi:hypothetical protein
LALNGFTRLGGEAIFDLANNALYDRLLSNGTVQITTDAIITINFLTGFNYQEGLTYTFDLMQGVSGDHLTNIQWNNLDTQWTIATDTVSFTNGTLAFNLVQIPEPNTTVTLALGVLILLTLHLRRPRTDS